MFAIIFTFVIITIHVKAEIPSYIHACGRNNSNYNQCITDNINHVKNKVCTGFPEFDISPNEPLILDKIAVFDTDRIKLYFRDVKVFNYCDFDVKSVYTDSERHHFDIQLVFKSIYINSTYDLDMRLLIPIVHTGLVEIMTASLESKLSLDLKVITKHGKKQIFASKVNFNCNIKSFNYKLNDNKKELVQLREIIDDIVAKNKEDIVRNVKSAIEKRFSRLIISIFNNLAHSNYEKLFPEKI